MEGDALNDFLHGHGSLPNIFKLDSNISAKSFVITNSPLAFTTKSENNTFTPFPSKGLDHDISKGNSNHLATNFLPWLNLFMFILTLLMLLISLVFLKKLKKIISPFTSMRTRIYRAIFEEDNNMYYF